MRKVMRLLYAMFLMVTLSFCASDQPGPWVIESPDHDLVYEPVSVEVSSDRIPAGTLCMVCREAVHPAQIEQLDGQRSRIWWTVSQSAGERVSYELRSGEECQSDPLIWHTVGEQSDRLSLGNNPLVQYEYPVFDHDDIEETKKPFHHVFDPVDSRKITKGPGGRFSHHRGIFLGYYAFIDGSDERVDIWHARDGERSEHNRIIRKMEGPVMGGHVLAIDWKDHDGNPFIEEERDFRVFRQPEGELLIEVRSVLTALRDEVYLGGDRQHAGMQFRASQYVADHPDATRFIRPEGWHDLAADTEIDDQTEIENIIDLPWNAMFFEIEDRNYTVSYLSHPHNPEGAEMSERLYGRFGEFFDYELTRGQSLEMTYRFWVKSGDAPSRTEIQNRYNQFAHPPVIIAR